MNYVRNAYDGISSVVPNSVRNTISGVRNIGRGIANVGEATRNRFTGEDKLRESQKQADFEYNHGHTGASRGNDDYTGTVHVVSMLRIIMRNSTIPINPNWTDFEPPRQRTPTILLKDPTYTYHYATVDNFGTDTFRKKPFSMYVVIGTHSSYELGGAHGNPPSRNDANAIMTKHIDKNIVPSNIAWFSTLSGPDTTDHRSGSRELRVYTETDKYACNASDYLNDSSRFDNNIPKERRDQRPDAIGIPSNNTRKDALKLIHQKLDASDGQYTTVRIALFEGDKKGGGEEGGEGGEGREGVSAAYTNSEELETEVYQTKDAEIQCSFYTVADLQWLVARLIWDRRNFDQVMLPSLLNLREGKHTHSSLFKADAFKILVGEALVFSRHEVMTAVREGAANSHSTHFKVTASPPISVY
jgi:hypothetical protein